jgi:hypothetical protein
LVLHDFGTHVGAIHEVNERLRANPTPLEKPAQTRSLTEALRIPALPTSPARWTWNGTRARLLSNENELHSLPDTHCAAPARAS